MAANINQDIAWDHLSLQDCAAALVHVKAYIYDFIGFIQSGQDELTYMIMHLFQAIISVFCLNNTNDRALLNPISIKKLKKGNGYWSTTNTEIGWAINTANHFLTLTVGRE